MSLKTLRNSLEGMKNTIDSALKELDVAIKAQVDNVITFVPVESLKLGDWVVVLPQDDCFINAEQGIAQEVIRVDNGRVTVLFSNGSQNSYRLVRMATPAEVADAVARRQRQAKAPNYSVAGNYCNFNKGAKTVSFGCLTLNKGDVAMVLKVIKSTGDFRIEGHKLDEKQVQATYDYLNLL